MDAIQSALILLAAIIGSVISWYLGWKESGTPFDLNKAIPSVIRAVIAGIVLFVLNYEGFLGEINIFTYFVAFLAGVGIDAGGNRLAGVIRAIT